MSLRNRVQGFLLIEVLVTVAMLAFGLVYISRGFTNCLRAMSQIANYTTAINLAEEKIFQLQSESRPEISLTEEGVFADNPNFNYKLEAKKLEDLELSELYLQVNWKEGRRTGSFEISSYL
ncbi:MAG: hypothetical protein A3J51_00800 [Omnitrophica WOR_2 bacterium RIFCSPHIGHO2_02_FULL_45_21]|nr:MAG: hypothetical protein A3J51_00800 [Omnitrophica WOR_2 bacterium RIFCSPHIGHO2_02_FULL_45_21]